MSCSKTMSLSQWQWLLPATALFKLATFGSAFCWEERKINTHSKIHVVLYVTNQPFHCAVCDQSAWKE